MIYIFIHTHIYLVAVLYSVAVSITKGKKTTKYFLMGTYRVTGEEIFKHFHLNLTKPLDIIKNFQELQETE